MDFGQSGYHDHKQEDGKSGKTKEITHKSVSLGELARANRTGNVVHMQTDIKLDFDSLCDEETSKWDSNKKRCVGVTKTLCAPGSEAIATMCKPSGNIGMDASLVHSTWKASTLAKGLAAQGAI